MYLPGLWTIPPVDRDEARFAQASRQMFQSGDWIIPRVQDKPRLNKPPLIYWCQCASIAVFGDRPGQYAHGNIWVFRVPSVLAAIGSALLTWRIGLRLMDPRAAALGAALLAVSPMVVWDAHQARADQLLLLCTTGAMFALVRIRGRVDENRPARGGLVDAALLWLAIAAGVLTKGPITPMVVALTVVSLCVVGRRWRWMRDLRPVLGLLVLAAIVAPWVIAVGQRVGWSEYARIVLDETVGRSAGAKEGHWGPPGYHAVLLTALMWPGSLLTGWALLRGRALGTPETRRFLLCWIIPSWLVFELVSTKLPHYTLPLYPAVALLSAQAVVGLSGRGGSSVDVGTRIGFIIWWVVGLAATIGLSSLVVLAGTGEGRVFRTAEGFDLAAAAALLKPYGLPGVIILIALAASARSLVRGAILRGQVQAMVAVVLWGAVFLQYVLPGADRFWISSRIAAAAMQAGPAVPISNQTDFREDSLVFLTRGTIREGEAPAPGEHAVLLVRDDGPLRSPGEARLLGEVRGWNYSNGRAVHVLVLEHAPAETGP